MFDEGRIYVRRGIAHPDYDEYTSENDIALLELDEPLEFSSTVLPGCLDTQRTRTNYGDRLVVTGFGVTSKPVYDPKNNQVVNGGTRSRFLKELDIVDISETDERCASFEENICVDSKSPGTDESVCFFDIGKFF